MGQTRVGFAFCGSFCTFEKAIVALEGVCGQFGAVTPILSECAAATDTRFGTAAGWIERMETLTGNRAITSMAAAEPIGPRGLLDVLVVAPCTGNTLGKLAHGVTDTAVTMAVKAHLRNARPVVLAISTNDGLGAAAENIGVLLARKHLYFVPFCQDDPVGKPTSLVADFSQVGATVAAALEGKQLQPLLALGIADR